MTAGFASTSVSTTMSFTPGRGGGGHLDAHGQPEQPGGGRQRRQHADGLAANDAQGNPVPGQAVTLTAGGTGNTLNPNSGTTYGRRHVHHDAEVDVWRSSRR